MSGNLYEKALNGGGGQQIVSYVDGGGNKKKGTLAGYSGAGPTVETSGGGGGTLASYGGEGPTVETTTPRGGGGVLTSYGGEGQTIETATPRGGGPQRSGTSHWDSMYGDLDTAYQAQRDQNQRALEAAQARAREASAAQVEALNRGYQGTNRQLYRDYMQRQRTLPQQLAAQGYTGGLTESSRLRMGNAYEEALNTNEQARLGQEAGYGQALAQQLYEAQAARDAADNEALQNYYSQRNSLRAQQLQQEHAEQERERERERADLEARAATLAAQGDFSLYRQLGYTDREIRYLERMFRKQHPELFKSTSGGKKSGGGGGRRPSNDTKDGSRSSGADTTYDEVKGSYTDTPAYQAYLARLQAEAERQRRQLDRVR